MSLDLPSKPEVRLENSPLDEVVCQVKFPPILRISKETPIEIQEIIRDRFPGLQVEQGVFVQFPTIGSTEEPTVGIPPRIHRFLTHDEMTHVALASDFFALSTKAYKHWGDFVIDFKLVEDAVRSVYNPAYATRIGLRFINRFTLNNTGSNTLDELLDLFRSEFTCLIRADAWQAPLEMLSQVILPDGEGKLTIRNAYEVEMGNPFFILDFDYYEEGKLTLDDLVDRIEGYHTRIYDAFRWCLLDESLQRFRPLPS